MSNKIKDLDLFLKKHSNNANKMLNKWIELLNLDDIELVEYYINYNHSHVCDNLYDSLLNDKMSDNMANFIMSHINYDTLINRRFNEYELKEFMKKGYYTLCANLLNGVYYSIDNYLEDKVYKYVLKYGNVELLDLVYYLDIKDKISNDISWMYYFLRIENKPIDNSENRYLSMFHRLVEQIDDDLYSDMTDNYKTLIKYPELFIFYYNNFSDRLNSELMFKIYIECVINNNTKIQHILENYINNNINKINLESNDIISILCNTQCNNKNNIKKILDKFTISSYTYFCISIAKHPLFLDNEEYSNTPKFLELIPNLYENITIDNILLFYSRNIVLDNEHNEILSYCLSLNSNLDLCENNRLFLELRKLLFEYYRLDDECSQYPYSSNLQILTELYPNLYYTQKDCESNEYYYLLKDETPYSIEDYLSNREIFFDVCRYPVITPKETCLICLDTIKNTLIRCCDKSDFNGHTYCEECLEKWIVDGQKSCPTCRTKLF